MLDRPLMVASLAVAVFATLMVVLAPAIPFGARSPALHAAVETAAAIAALLAALLARLRFRRRRRLPDLALAVAFTAFGLTNLLYSALPAVVAAPLAGPLETWAALGARLLCAFLFAAAALLPDRSVLTDRAVRWTTVVPLAALVAIGVAMAAFRDVLPAGAGLESGRAAAPTLRAHPLLTASQALSLALYTTAALALWRRARAGDELAGWLASAAVFAASARLHYLLYPSLYTGVVYSGDVLRLGFYALLLAAVASEMEASSREAAHAEELEERRELARGLHDGLARSSPSSRATPERWPGSTRIRRPTSSPLRPSARLTSPVVRSRRWAGARRGRWRPASARRWRRPPDGSADTSAWTSPTGSRSSRPRASGSSGSPGRP